MSEILIKWIVFCVASSALPVLFGFGRLLIAGDKITPIVLFGKGELLVISVVIGGVALGELIFDKMPRNTVKIWAQLLCLVTVFSAAFMYGVVTPKSDSAIVFIYSLWIFGFTFIVGGLCVFLAGAGHYVEKAMLGGMTITPMARAQLKSSDLILTGGTREALLALVESADETDTTLAVCGNKGEYAIEYYKQNFARCKTVKRVFNFNSISGQTNRNKRKRALKGIKLHLNQIPPKDKTVDVFLIPENQSISSLTGGKFDPPLSFGIVILLDNKGNPKKAVLHWEMANNLIARLIGVDTVGIVVKQQQQQLLMELVQLPESLMGSDDILSTNKTIRSAMNNLVRINRSCLCK